MSTMQSIKTQLQSLLDRANAKTGKSHTNLTDSVNELISGYGSGGSAEIPTCTVRFVSGENVYYNYNYAYSKLENGKVVALGTDESNQTDVFDITFENVVCGSIMHFNWNYDGDYADVTVDGTAIQISSGYQVNESTLFVAPTVAGEVCTITIDAMADIGPGGGW